MKKTWTNRTTGLAGIIVLIVVVFYGFPYAQEYVFNSAQEIQHEKERYIENTQLIDLMASESTRYSKFAQALDEYHALNKEEKSAALIKTMEGFIANTGPQVIDLKAAAEFEESTSVEIEMVATMNEFTALLNEIVMSQKLIYVSDMMISKQESTTEDLVVRATFQWIGH